MPSGGGVKRAEAFEIAMGEPLEQRSAPNARTAQQEIVTNPTRGIGVDTTSSKNDSGASDEQERKSSKVELGVEKKRAERRSPIKTDRKAGTNKTKDPFDFQFELVIQEDMHSLLDTSTGVPLQHGQQAPTQVMYQGHDIDSRSETHVETSHQSPLAVSHMDNLEQTSPEESLPAKIELLREQCEDGLGMELFQNAYTLLQDHPDREAMLIDGSGTTHGLLANTEVREFLPDLLTLLRCEEIVFGAA